MWDLMAYWNLDCDSRDIMTRYWEVMTIRTVRERRERRVNIQKSVEGSLC